MSLGEGLILGASYVTVFFLCHCCLMVLFVLSLLLSKGLSSFYKIHLQICFIEYRKGLWVKCRLGCLAGGYFCSLPKCPV